MRFASSFPLLLSALLVCPGGLVQEASAQFFKSRRTDPATKYLNKQEPPKIEKALEPTINPGNSRVRISIGKQRAYVLVGDDVYIDTPISSGKNAGMTPKGTFHVMEKDPDHRSSVYGAFCDKQNRIVRSGVSLKVDSAPSGTHYVGAPMKWFMRLTGNGVGMHVGILPGYPASHGCIRLPENIAKLIYDKVKVGTLVVIED